MAVMRIDQAGLATGVAGRARCDGKSDGAEVTLTDLTPGGTTRFEILWVDPADNSALVSLGPTADSHVWKFTPAVGVKGGIRIRLTHTTPGNVVTSQIRIFGIPDDNGVVKPVPGERSDPNATRANATDPSVIDKCERNWPTDEFPAGNPFGWGLDMNRLLRGFEDAAQQSEIDDLSTELEATQTDLTALQAQVTTLISSDASQQAAIDDQAAAQAAALVVDNAQTAAISAVEAAVATNATAIDAAQDATEANAAAIATNTTAISEVQDAVAEHATAISDAETALTVNANAIASLQTQAATLERMSTVDLRRFVPLGFLLTDANIDDAIDAAIDWVVNNTAPGLAVAGHVVTAPAGTWTLSRPHVFPAFGNYRPPVSFRGASMYETCFLVTSDVEASAVFTFGTASFPNAEDMGFNLGVFVGGFSIVAANEGACNRTGIRMYGAVNPQVRDVRIRGLAAANSTPEQGRGLEILPVTVDSVVLNSQFVDVRDCDIYGCMTGIYIRGAYPVTLDNVHSQACYFQNAIFQSCKVTWANSGMQGGGAVGALHDRWYGNRNMPGVVSGFDSTAGLISATGCTCSSQTDGLCTVSGGTLTGLNAREDSARWVRLTPAGASANELKVGGVYKVERILSDGSLSVRKGSNHTSQANVAVQLCEAAGPVTLTIDNCYNETSVLRSSLGAWRDTLAASEWTVQDAEFQGGDFVIEANRIASVTVTGLRAANSATKVARLEYVGASNIEADIGLIEFDDVSYSAMRCLDNRAFPTDLTGKGYSRSANGGCQVRLREFLIEVGAVEIWDVRLDSLLSLTGLAVNSITGFINGTVLSFPATGTKPTYTELDPELDGPAIIGATGIGPVRAFLDGTISASVLPDFPYTTTLVLVGRVPDTGVSSTRRMQVKTEGPFPAFVQHTINLHDGQYIGTGPYSYYRNHNNYFPNQEGSASYSLTPDTLPHVFVAGAVSAIGYGGQVRSWDRGVYLEGGAVAAKPSHFVGSNMTVGIGAEFGQVESGSLIWSFAAVVPHTLSPAEHQKLVGLARIEWPLEA